LTLWSFLARRPALYRAVTALLANALAVFGRSKGHFAKLPFAGGWTDHRDMPAPQGGTFQRRWNAGERG
jgi:L-lactate dehydrogenase complex protein LldF